MLPLRLYTLEDLPSDFGDSPVLVRVDFNVPIQDDVITDDTRILEALPTLRELLSRNARLVVASHRGRPRGKPDPALTLKPIARRLGELLGEGVVQFAEDAVGPARREAQQTLQQGHVLLLENLRFDPREKENDAGFAAALASGCAAYVDDAFGCVHRAHASVDAVVACVPQSCAGRLVVREVDALSRLIESPQRPMAALLGGAKISGKIDTLESLVERVDLLLLGGGMANTFLAARDHDLARSLVEEDRLDLARRILERAEGRGVEVLLPRDVVVTDDLGAPSPRHEVVAIDRLPDWAMAVDLGPETISRYCAAITKSKTLFWNGPMGVFEKPPFDQGSLEIARAVAECDGFTVIGGGETGAVAHLAGVADQIDHVSTGGGASLQFLAETPLPGLEVLRRPGDSGEET